MEELTYIIEIIEPTNINIKFGKPFYNFSIEIIKINYDDNDNKEKELEGLFYNG